MPMEIQRSPVTIEPVLEDFPRLRNAIDDVLIPFARNIDKIEHSDWADAHPETLYVLTDLINDQVPLPVNRAGNRILFTR
jgi:hypothetical protein